MNKILVGINVVLVAAVAFLFFKVNSLSPSAAAEKSADAESKEPAKETTEPVKTMAQVANTPTGKIAYINIDELNEKSLEINDLINDAKKRRNSIEGKLENLNMQYQKKMEEYQNSAKAGLASPSDLQMKEKEILAIEKDAQNTQLQMENLTMQISDKNTDFQKNVKNFLIKWNNGRFDFILSYSDAVPSMLLGNASLEITKEVIEQLNAEYKVRTAKK